MEVCRRENADRLINLERSNLSMVTTMRGLKRGMDALATKEGVSRRHPLGHEEAPKIEKTECDADSNPGSRRHGLARIWT